MKNKTENLKIEYLDKSFEYIEIFINDVIRNKSYDESEKIDNIHLCMKVLKELILKNYERN